LSILGTRSFEVRENEVSAAKGRKLLTLHRDGDITTYVSVGDLATEGTVVLSIDVGGSFGHSTTRLPLTPDEARSLAASLAQVARFVDEAGE
jgi:hypothetical protein